MTVRVTDVRVPFQSQALVADVLQSGNLAAGAYVEAVEQLTAACSRTMYAVATNSGTAALQLALETAGVEPDDKVAVPALTFAGTANAVWAAGGTPVVVDVGEDRLLNPELIPDDIDFVVPVHLYGHLADTNLPGAVEDAAQAIGQPLTHGAISLYGSKTAGCGEGGVFVTNDADAAEYARVVRNQGMTDRYNHVAPGLNLRLSNLSAAVSLGQLTNLTQTIGQRQAHADILWQAFHDLPVTLPNPFGSVWHQFVVEVPNRDDIQKHMLANGVETAVHYPVALSQVGWLEADECPVAERMVTEVLSLPVHEHLTVGDLEQVIGAFRQAVEACVLV